MKVWEIVRWRDPERFQQTEQMIGYRLDCARRKILYGEHRSMPLKGEEVVDGLTTEDWWRDLEGEDVEIWKIGCGKKQRAGAVFDTAAEALKAAQRSGPLGPQG